MKTTNKIIIAVLIIAVLLVSVGYAAIQNITLNISGTASGTADDANFKVKFLETTEVSDSSKVTATVTDDTNAAINVIGLSAKGQIVTAIYTVQNVSTDLSANLSVNTTNNNEEYFAIESNLGKTSLVAGEVTTLTVTVEVIKTPITTDEVASIGIGLIAEPVQPGEEGGTSSEGGSTGGETVATKTSAGTYLPTGFTEVAGTSLANGLTIQDASGNQYVWIEVPQTEEVYKTAGLEITEFNDEEYKAIEDDLHTYTATYRNDTSYTDTYSTEAATGLTETKYYELKEKMLKSVYQNGGFYVGKYETGIASTYRSYEMTVENFVAEHPIEETPVIKANAYPYTWVRCSQAQALASSMSSGEYTSSLMFGVQWDLVLKHIEVQAVKSGYKLETIYAGLNTDSTNFGNCLNSEFTITNTSAKYSTINVDTMEVSEYKAIEESYNKASGECATLTTGASESFGAFGIYDIAGNMAEWTLEYTSDASSPCASRGSICDDSGTVWPASSRGSFYATVSVCALGFRSSLY